MLNVLLFFAVFFAGIAVCEAIRIVYFEIRLARIMRNVRRHFELTKENENA